LDGLLGSKGNWNCESVDFPFEDEEEEEEDDDDDGLFDELEADKFSGVLDKNEEDDEEGFITGFADKS